SPRCGFFTLLAVLACLPFVIPLVWMTSASLLPEIDVTANLALFPYHPQWHNYADALGYFPAFHYLLNTLEIAIPAALGTVISSSWIAYGFSNLQWRGREKVSVHRGERSYAASGRVAGKTADGAGAGGSKEGSGAPIRAACVASAR
ncbi:MAG TPA: hypothetical protein VHB98_14500, partial [Chloroflexota bacterium]|nr:hypothetical protein [Chloroflexota bacterium]